MQVIIPTHRRPKLLARTLESVSRCVLPDEYQGTLVVENGEEDTGRDIALRMQHRGFDVQYFHVQTANKSTALNHAIENAADGLLVFFDDDIRVDPQILQHYAKAAYGVDESVFFGGAVKIDYEEAPPKWLHGFLPASASGWPRGEWSAERNFLGCNWAAFRRAVCDAGRFDPSCGPGTDSTGCETDMQRRLRDLGGTPCYIPNALVWHYVPRDRCSPAWAIRRGYRMGIDAGHALGRETMGAWPARYVWKELLIRGWRVFRKSLGADRKDAFEARYRFWHYYGKVKGAFRSRGS